MSLLGIDIGTTGCKVIAFSDKGELLARSYRTYQSVKLMTGYAELDAVDVWNKIKDAIKEVAVQTQHDPIKALSVSSLGEAVVAVSSNGKILGNSILGADIRGEEYAYMIENEFGTEAIYKQTGNLPSAFYSMSKIVWLQKNHPSVHHETSLYLTWADFVCYKLSGIAFTNYSLAGRTLLFDIHKVDWSSQFFNFLKLEVEKFPKPIPSGIFLGNVKTDIAEKLNLDKNVAVISGGHDQCCAALGAGLGQDEDHHSVMYAMGTFLCAVTVFDEMPNLELMYEKKLHLEYHVVPNKYISFIYNSSGGAMVNWFKENMFADKKSYESMFKELPESASDIQVSTKFGSNGPPDFSKGGEGFFSGLSFNHTRSDIFRVSLENAAIYMRDTIKLLSPFFDAEIFIATGGGANSEKWLKITSDILNKTVVRPAITEASSLGAAIIAGVGSGIFSSFNEAIKSMVHISQNNN